MQWLINKGDRYYYGGQPEHLRYRGLSKLETFTGFTNSRQHRLTNGLQLDI